MIDQQWLTIIIVLLIVAIIVDGVRRMRNAKRDSIKMSLRKHFDEEVDDDVIYGSEFPNGGARTSQAQIDKERILKARSRYNFGDGLPAWNKEDKATSADQDKNDTVEADDHSRSADPASGEKIEPSFSESTALNDIESAMEPEPQSADVTVKKPVKPSTDSKSTESFEPSSEEPVQTRLNLDDDVPMLMEEIDAKDTDGTEEHVSPPQVEPKHPKIEQNKIAEKPIRSVAAAIEPALSEVETHSANKPNFESKYTSHISKNSQSPQDVIVMNLRAREGEFLGSDLLPVILDNGLRFGAMDIFHYHAEEDGEGDVLFSMANIVKPGTFDLAHFETFETVGLSFFLTLPVSVGSHMQAFEQMVEVVQAMAKAMDANLLDENRSVLTLQTIEHYRERVRDFSRREQLEKNK